MIPARLLHAQHCRCACQPLALWVQDSQAVVMKTMTRTTLTEKDKLEVRCS